MYDLLLSLSIIGRLLGSSSPCVLRCECLMHRSSQDALRSADAAFLGRIIASRDTVLTLGTGRGAPYVIITFRVERRWKGPATEQIEVLTAFHSAACGTSFSRHEPYLVFAHRNAQHLLVTTSCDFNRPQTEAKGDIRALGTPVFIRRGSQEP